MEMKTRNVFAKVLMFATLLISEFAMANTSDDDLFYDDYRAIQRILRDETKNVESEVDRSNDEFISQISRYGRCKSNKWRALFEIPLSELNERRKGLGDFKRDALDRKSDLNKEWLTTSSAIRIQSVNADQPITDFVIWYESFAADMRQGPLQDLKLYVHGLDKLSAAYQRMSRACEGDSSAANDAEVWTIGVRGLIAEVTGILGQVN